MSNITVRNKTSFSLANIGAIVCRTPKTLPDTVVDNKLIDGRCKLVYTIDELLQYFGDPYIDPSEYVDLIAVYDLVRRNIPIVVSSVYDMKDNDDGFSIKYNGFTHFVFKDENEDDLVGYEIKSDIKMCQPIIQSSFSDNILTVYVSLYLLDRSSLHTEEELNILDASQLYDEIEVSFNKNEIDDITDSMLISELADYGLELRVINGESASSLVDKLMEYEYLNISLTQKDSHGNNITEYHYNLNSNDYCYGLIDDSYILEVYSNAIDRLTTFNLEPNWLCVGKLYKTLIEAEDEVITRSYMVDLDPSNYNVIHEYLLNLFNEESNTYLLISTPDVSFSTSIELLSSDQVMSLPENYNCDMFFGYASDFIASDLIYNPSKRVYYSAALLVFYSIMSSNSIYVTNPIKLLNIANRYIKSVITEQSASDLRDLRCNSVVLFDTGSPSIYGDRSMSLLPNLRYSHISRNFVRLRREIRNYLETQKFSIVTQFNSDICSNHIRHVILDSYVTSGILSRYLVSLSVSNNITNIEVKLQFNDVIQTINLEFTI